MLFRCENVGSLPGRVKVGDMWSRVDAGWRRRLPD